jgi:hypothetical protein
VVRRLPAHLPSPPLLYKREKMRVNPHFNPKKEKALKREERRREERRGRERGEALLHLIRGFEDHFLVSSCILLLLLISTVALYDIGFRHV